nr:MAG TPA: hypothetical protein [Bacteriophage sp.]
MCTWFRIIHDSENPIEIPFLTACRRRLAIAGTTERRHPNTPLLVIEKAPHRKVSGPILLLIII